MLDLVLDFFECCRVAGLMKNEHQLSLTLFLDYSNLYHYDLLWCKIWHSYYLRKIRLQLLLGFFYGCAVVLEMLGMAKNEWK